VSATTTVSRVRGDDPRSDEELAAAAARGDGAALDALLARHLDRIVAVCRRVLSNRDDALDAAQEALIAVSRRIDRYDGSARFTTWLYRVATNAAIDEARRRGRRPTPVELLPERAGDAGLDDAVVERLDIDEALAALRPEFRAAVALRDVAGLDYAEIAAVLDLPPGTVRSRIARGRAALADRLGNREPDLDRHTTERP
jgi:RNA polymerase sigma-70 factor (ECF subfamily)